MPWTRPSMKMRNGNRQRYHKARHWHNQLASLLRESCYCNLPCSPRSLRLDGRTCAWLLDILHRNPSMPAQLWFWFREPHRKHQLICPESSRSFFERRLSRRRFLTGLFIFEKWSRKMRRRSSPNTLIIKDIQIHCEDYDGTRIAFLRRVCLPSRS